MLEKAVADPRPDGPPSTAAVASYVSAEVERLGGLDKPYPRLTLTASLPVLARRSDQELAELRRIALVFQLSTNRWEIVRDEGLLAGLRDGDVARLRDAVWTHGRLVLGSFLMSRSGYDHAMSAWSVLEAIAVGDTALVDAYLPAGTPPAGKGLPVMRSIVNTVVALRHGEHVTAAAEQALHAAGLASRPQFERLVSGYLHALVVQDRAAAETALEEIARTWSSTPWLRAWKDPIVKDLAMMLHGLVALGRSRFDGIDRVADGARAYSPALAQMVGSVGTMPQPPTPVVAFTGPCAVANGILRERPLS